MNKGKSLLVFHTLFFLSFFSIAQSTGTLSGFVTDNEIKQPVAGANIYELTNISHGTVSEKNGHFTLSLPAGDHQMICSFIGMESDTFPVTISENKETFYNVALQSSVKDLNVIVVSASKYEQKLEDITVSMQVIQPKIISDKNITNIANALEQTPGITILDEEPQIRGGSGFTFGVGSRVTTLIDGVPIISGDIGKPVWSFIPLENLEQIEVIKGASSVLFGSSALSGAINVRTTYPKEKPVTNVDAWSGFYDTPKNKAAKWWNGNANFSGISFMHSQRYGKFDLVLGGQALYDHNFIGPPIESNTLPLHDTISNSEVADRSVRINFNTRYRFEKTKGLSAGINGNIMQSHTNFSLIWQDDTSGIYRAYPKTMTLTNALAFYVDPYITYFTSSGLKHDLRGRIYYQNNDNTNDQSNRSTVYYAEYKVSKELKNIDLNYTAGIVMNNTQSHAELFSYSGSPDNRIYNYSVYTQFDKKFWDVLNMSFGFRGEYFRINKTESVTKPIFRAGMNLKLAKETYVRYSYGQGYRYPTVAEKFTQTFVGGIQLFPNPDLKPESSWNTEVGLLQEFKIKHFIGFIDLAGYWQEFKNTIEYNYAGFAPDTAGFKFLNTGDTRVRGIDISLSGRGKLSKNLELEILCGYNYVLPQALEPDYVYAVGIPGQGFIDSTRLSYTSTSTDTTNHILKYRFQTTAKADVQVTYKKIFVGFSTRYYSFMRNIDKTFYDLDETVLPTGIKKYREEHNSGTTVTDVRAGCKINRRFTVSVIINNVFNLEYSLRPLKIESPRTVAFKIRYEV